MSQIKIEIPHTYLYHAGMFQLTVQNTHGVLHLIAAASALPRPLQTWSRKVLAHVDTPQRIARKI